MKKHELRAAQKHLVKLSRKYNSELVEIPVGHLSSNWGNPPIRAYRSNRYLVQVFEEKTGVRLSICTARLDDAGRWLDGISWEQLQKLKREAGYGDRLAVEIYPADENIINVANMRHLWIYDELSAIGWKVENKQG